METESLEAKESALERAKKALVEKGDEEKGMAQRAVFIIDPDGILRVVEIVADAIGRNASEILRKLKALNFVRKNPGHVCPASWDEGSQTLEPSIKKAGKVYKELK